MRAERFLTKEKASIKIYGKTGNLIASVKNLSKTGACLEWQDGLELEIQQGDLIRMTVILKALNRRHQLSAEVVWTDGNQTGVTFIAADSVLERMVGK